MNLSVLSKKYMLIHVHDLYSISDLLGTIHAYILLMLRVIIYICLLILKELLPVRHIYDKKYHMTAYD